MSENRPVCDVCGVALTDSDIRYTIADKWDDEGNWTVARHARCQNERDDKIRAGLDSSMKRLRGLVGELRGRTR